MRDAFAAFSRARAWPACTCMPGTRSSTAISDSIAATVFVTRAVKCSFGVPATTPSAAKKASTFFDLAFLVSGSALATLFVNDMLQSPPGMDGYAAWSSA